MEQNIWWKYKRWSRTLQKIITGNATKKIEDNENIQESNNKDKVEVENRSRNTWKSHFSENQI